ncbi:MAG: M48 family metalloprotease [Flavobacteriales bacterium]|nr:M48 family metalloprotease [Flavobacteriales bacterium]
MRINLFIITLLILIAKSVTGQNVDNFKVLKSQGAVPKEFNTLSSEKVKEQTKNIDKSQKRVDRKAEKVFILQSNYFIDEVLSNGAILYNDELSNYVGRVADELLKDNNELRSQLRFYVIKSSVVNAFATDRGSIFITVGLLAQIENEAQLAYILSHEMIHFIKKHAKTGFIEKDRIENRRGEYRRMAIDKELNKSKYSKELEIEADEEGLQIYLKSNYSLTELDAVFDVLQYAHLPIEDEHFDTTFFNDIFFQIPSSCIKDELEEIKVIDDDEDDYGTHPNINKRRAIVSNEIEGESNEGKQIFIVSKDKFNQVKDKAQFELSYLYVKSRLYAESIYNSYILLKKYPNNEYLKTNIAYCLYALATYKNAKNYHEVLTDYDDVEGQSQQIHYILDKMDKKVINTLAVKYLWDLKNSGVNNNFVNTIAEGAIKQLLVESGARKLDYKKKLKEDVIVVVKDLTKINKYDKIKKNKEKKSIVKYAFVDLFKNKEFKKLIDFYEKEYISTVKDNETKDYYAERLDARQKRIKGRALGIDKIVMVTPNYKKYDLRKEIAAKHVYSESRKEDFVKLNQYCADKKGVDLSLISNTYFEDTDTYNDMSLLNDWMDERFAHENIKIYPYCTSFTEDLVKKYGTEYFAWSGIYALRTKKTGWGWIAASLLYYGVGVPIGIYYAFTPENHTYYYTYLVNISNYDFLMSKEEYVKMKDHNDLMKSYIYDTYNQVKTKPKNKKK